ncbi:hypothetical protein [Hyphobacterium sp.]|uniref:hypothetical protein n=1 Tax=Hyphobacterium sp. TaxID=2004662 RepID=UPI003BABFAFC
MAKVYHASKTNGRVVFDNLENDILIAQFSGEIDLDFAIESADYIIEYIESGARRLLYNLGEAIPVFSPVVLMDEVRRIGRAAGKSARFAYLAPEDMFARHFMLIEAAAFNDGIDVKFFSDMSEARKWLKEAG